MATHPGGSTGHLCMGSANRDETRWPDPNTFDIHRPRQAHISFAGGIHICLGMHLARMETRAMLNSLFDRVTTCSWFPTHGLPGSSECPSAHRKSFPSPSAPVAMKSRAAILHDVGGPWSVEEYELDPPSAGEVLVQLAAAGLCHSDDHILKGDMSAPNEVMRSMGLPTMFPMIGGHEGSGIVREVGDGVTDFAPGDHVAMSFIAVCGQCRWCATGCRIHLRRRHRHHDAGYADRRHIPPSHRRRARSRPRRQDRHVRRTHRGIHEFACEARSSSYRCCPARCCRVPSRPATVRLPTAPTCAPATPSW